RVVDQPRLDGLSRREDVDDVPGGLTPHGSILPRALANEVQEPVVRPACSVRLRARACGDRLDALALTVSEKAEGVRRERLPLSGYGKVEANPREVLRHAPAGDVVHG